jgi:hypothetical protein
MMVDGDKSGLWHLLEAGQKNAIFMGQLPWLGRIFLKYPRFASDLKAFRLHARSRAVIRNQNGSPHKDIFHHLMDEDNVAMQRPSIVEVVSDGMGNISYETDNLLNIHFIFQVDSQSLLAQTQLQAPSPTFATSS